MRIPFTDFLLYANVGRRLKPTAPEPVSPVPEVRVDLRAQELASVALSITSRHIAAVLRKCPDLEQYFDPCLVSSQHDTSAFLDFLDDTVAIFLPQEAKEVHIRRQLAKLREHVKGIQAREHIARLVAMSDLRDGVVERALILEGDAHYGQCLDDAITVFDHFYESSPPFLRDTRTRLDFSGDVRGNSLRWFFQQAPEILRGKRILHIAPEAPVSQWIRSEHADLRCDYQTLDGFSTETDYIQDITDLQFPDGSFDVVICHRVLEHVLDDDAALHSIFRILSPQGMLSISVPQSMNNELTKEWVAQDLTHHHHIRQYGRDFVERLSKAGFLANVERGLLERTVDEHRAEGTYPMRHYLCHKSTETIRSN